MKKALVLVGTLALAGSLFGQGEINFSNIGQPITTAAGGFAGTTYWGQLWGGPDADSLTAVGSPYAFRNNSTTGLPTGIVTAGGDNPLKIATVVPGAEAYVQLRAWAAASGSSWDAAFANPQGEFNASGTLHVAATGNGTTLPAPTLVSAGLTSFQLVLVPEPSTWALLALGLGALALRRRK